MRSAAELLAAVDAVPFPHKDVDAEIVHVMFLADRPTAAQAASLDAQRSPGDAFQVVGREVYLRLPNGAGRSKLRNAYFDSKLKTTSTVRNWRTTLKLLALATA